MNASYWSEYIGNPLTRHELIHMNHYYDSKGRDTVKNKKFWLILAFLIGIYVLVLRPIIADSDAQLNSSPQRSVVAAKGDEEANKGGDSNRLIYITGAVESPGLYEIQEGATLGVVIQLCGGFLPYAAVESLNLADTAEVGSHIHVGFNFKGNPEVLLQKQKVNLNTADEKGLIALSGVGPGTAKKILGYRKEHGGFKSIEELKNIKGIGEATYKKLAPQVTI